MKTWNPPHPKNRAEQDFVLFQYPSALPHCPTESKWKEEKNAWLCDSCSNFFFLFFFGFVSWNDESTPSIQSGINWWKIRGCPERREKITWQIPHKGSTAYVHNKQKRRKYTQPSDDDDVDVDVDVEEKAMQYELSWSLFLQCGSAAR